MRAVTTIAERILCLESFVAETGLSLPRPAQIIACLEADGHIVNLITGAVEERGGGRTVDLADPQRAQAWLEGGE